MTETYQVPIDEEIITDRCKLRIVNDGDTRHVWSATQHKGFNDGLRWDSPQHINQLKKPLTQNIDDWRTGAAYTWTIQDLTSAEFLGRIVLKKDDKENEWSIGFWIHPIYQRQGFATEAARAIVHFAFTMLNAQSIYSAHAHWNKASQKVLEKLDMKLIGNNPCGLMKNGECIAENVYAISRGMWLKSDGAKTKIKFSMSKLTADV